MNPPMQPIMDAVPSANAEYTVLEYSILDMPLAVEFLKAIGDNVVLVNNTPYIYEGRLWVCDNTKRKLQLLIVNTLLPVFQKCYVKETQTLSGMLVGNTNPEKEKTEKNIALNFTNYKYATNE